MKSVSKKRKHSTDKIRLTNEQKLLPCGAIDLNHPQPKKNQDQKALLNENICSLLFLYFAPRELSALSLVCKCWNTISKQESLWRNVLLLRSGDIYNTSYRERIKAETCAENLLVLFDKKSFNKKLRLYYPTKSLKEITDQEKDITRDRLQTFLSDLSPAVQVAMMKEFLIKNPEFDIQERTCVHGDLSLPILLHDNKLQAALKYLLSQRQYDKDEIYAGEYSLTELIAYTSP